MAARDAAVVTDRVRTIIRIALYGEPARWWDAEELAGVVEERAPGLSADPLAMVRLVLRKELRGGAPWLEWDRQARRSARARLLERQDRGVAVLVYRWGLPLGEAHARALKKAVDAAP